MPKNQLRKYAISRRALLLSVPPMFTPGQCRAETHHGPVKVYYPPSDAEGGWRTLEDASAIRKHAGMDKTRLDRAWEFTQRCSANEGLCVVRRGFLVLERYAGRAQRNVNPDMASTGKAFTSIACGIMLKEFHDRI